MNLRGLFILLLTFLPFIFLGACSVPQKIFEKEGEAYRHTPSQALYPKTVGNYDWLENDARQALKVDKKSSRKSTAVYMDYKSGGVMTSILHRPFARVETLPKPKNVSFKDFVSQNVKSLSNDQVLDDTTLRTNSGQVREIRVKGEEAFMAYSFPEGGKQKLPAVTKLVFIEKGNYVIFMKTSYPTSEADLLAKPNREFVDKFIKAQM